MLDEMLIQQWNRKKGVLFDRRDKSTLLLMQEQQQRQADVVSLTTTG